MAKSSDFFISPNVNRSLVVKAIDGTLSAFHNNTRINSNQKANSNIALRARDQSNDQSALVCVTVKQQTTKNSRPK